MATIPARTKAPLTPFSQNVTTLAAMLIAASVVASILGCLVLAVLRMKPEACFDACAGAGLVVQRYEPNVGRCTCAPERNQ